MPTKAELDLKIAGLERTLLSGDVDDRVRRIDDLIEKMQKRREALYDRALPVGGNGFCRDGGALDAVGTLDKEIGELKGLRSKTLSGDLDEDIQGPAPAATPPPTTVLSLPTEFKTSEIADPFDSLEKMPTEEAELKEVLDQALEFGISHVNQLIATARSIARDQEKAPRRYTQGEHLALRAALGMLWVETRRLFKFAREQRLDLEARVASLEARPAVPWEGPWDAEKQFPASCFCTHGGGMWFAAAASKGVRPGTGDGVWRLAVKAGKDGKDLR